MTNILSALMVIIVILVISNNSDLEIDLGVLFSIINNLPSFTANLMPIEIL